MMTSVKDMFYYMTLLTHFVETGEISKTNTAGHRRNVVHIWSRNLSDLINISRYGH